MVVQGLPYLANGGVDTGVDVYMHGVAPNGMDDLFPSDECSPPADQQREYLHWRFLQLYRPPGTDELEGGEVEDEVRQ